MYRIRVFLPTLLTAESPRLIMQLQLSSFQNLVIPSLWLLRSEWVMFLVIQDPFTILSKVTPKVLRTYHKTPSLSLPRMQLGTPTPSFSVCGSGLFCGPHVVPSPLNSESEKQAQFREDEQRRRSVQHFPAPRRRRKRRHLYQSAAQQVGDERRYLNLVESWGMPRGEAVFFH